MRCSIYLADKLLNPELFAYLTTPKYGVISANVVLSGWSANTEAVQKRASGKFEGGLLGTEASVRGERHRISAVAFMVAGGGFEPPTFGLCDLTHLSMRVGLYLHPSGVLAIQSLRLPPPFRGLGSVLPYRSRDVGSTDFDE
jgi:hypothetical protein